MSLNRKPIQIVEIDIDYCTHTFGNAPCTAALASGTPRKCFNTFFTCADTANFNKGTLTLRFAKNINGLPKGTLIYPALRGVSTNPASINLGGIDERTGPLGKRARVNIDLQDFVDNDSGVDLYHAERRSGAAQFDGNGYDPSRGTFFGKLRRRYPYYIGRALRVLNGYEGQALADMRTEHYVVSEWPMSDMSGRVRIVAKDVLDLADNKKALCPKPSTGKLGADITTDNGVSFDLVPSGSGAEYPASGRVSIGSEIARFTLSGDTMTLIERAVDGSEVSTHSQDDLVQLCYRVENEPIADVAEDLLTTFASISSSFIPSSEWDDEGDWLAGFNLTATIAKPTGVQNLIGELAQLGVFWWWSSVEQKVKMRANRPTALGETFGALSDDLNVNEGSLAVKDLFDKRVTRVVFWHGQIDPTQSATNGENYSRAHVAVNDGGNENQHNQERTVEIFSRWLGTGNDAVAAAAANRLAVRFEETPRAVTFKVDAKDRDNIAVADLVTLTTRALQDDTGLHLATDTQITSVEEHAPGHALTVTAQTYEFQGRYGFVTENSRPDYDASTDAQKAKGTYIVGGSGVFSDGTESYKIF